MTNKFKNLFTWLGIIAVLVLLFLFLYDPISPADATRTKMIGICVRINMYIEQHGVPPESLQQLPVRSGYNDRITDGWGKEIKYENNKISQTITLLSYGKDSKIGGRKENRDIKLVAVLVNNAIPLEDYHFEYIE